MSAPKRYLKTPGAGGLTPQGPSGVHPQPQQVYNATSSGNGPPAAGSGYSSQFYWDNSTTPATLYVNNQGTWQQVGTPLPSIADGDVLANISGATAQPIGEPLSAVFDHIFSNVQGAILFRGAANWQALAPGLLGQLLQANGGAANPSWVTFQAGNKAYFGSGPPSLLHLDGDTYYDTSTSPYQMYVQHLGGWWPANCCVTGGAALETQLPSFGIWDATGVGQSGMYPDLGGGLIS